MAEGGSITVIKNYCVAKRNEYLELCLPNKKEYYVNRRFDRESYERALSELTKQIYTLAKADSGIRMKITAFTKQISRHLLIRNETKDNQVFSPATLYIVLCALSELSEGTSRSEILKLLGYNVDSFKSDEIEKLMRAFSISAGKYKNYIASSIFLA